jgi:hypothetical protein
MCDVSTRYETNGTTGGISEANVTNNCDVDLDGDGMWDSWELTHFGNLNQTGTGDYDGDGMTNLQEFQSGTDPSNQDSDGDGVIDQVFKVYVNSPRNGGNLP